MKEKLYRVRFKRPDGTEAWLGPPCGGAKTEEMNATVFTGQAGSGIGLFP